MRILPLTQIPSLVMATLRRAPQGVAQTHGGLPAPHQTRLDAGESPESIFIDSLTSSVVYSSQHVNPLWNRANIWYDTCTRDGGRS
jgi:hypothetical protein